MNTTVDFEFFKGRATRDDLSPDERSGFQARHRDNKSPVTAEDILQKLGPSLQEGSTLIDIGCGCSALTTELISRTSQVGLDLILVDSEEVLAALGDTPDHVTTSAHRFPDDLAFLDQFRGRSSAVLMYSVIQCVGREQKPIDLLLTATELLSSQGRLLVGDIPNQSKKNRYLSSEFGQRFNSEWQQAIGVENLKGLADSPPQNSSFSHSFDDHALLEIITRIRESGHEAYILPQPEGLAMNWTREDLLIFKW